MQETFFSVRNWAFNTLTSILNVGCQTHASSVVEASEWLQALEQLPTCGWERTGLETEAVWGRCVLLFDLWLLTWAFPSERLSRRFKP